MSFMKGAHGTLLRGLEDRHYCVHFIEKLNNAQKPRSLYRSQKRQGTKAVLVKSELLCCKERHIVVTYIGREVLCALDSKYTVFQKQAFSQHGVLQMLEHLPIQKFPSTLEWHYKVCAPIWSTMRSKCLSCIQEYHLNWKTIFSLDYNSYRLNIMWKMLMITTKETKQSKMTVQ